MVTPETRTQQFGLISGIGRQQSDMVVSVEPGQLFAAESLKGALYIVGEVAEAGGRGRDACALVLRTIRRHYYQDGSLSITAALRKAVLAANSALYQENFRVSAVRRATIGVTCAVVRGDDLHLVRVAPAQIFLFADGTLRAIPPASSWGAAAPPAQAIALGATLSIEPEFYRATLRPGDGLLIGTTSLDPVVGRNEFTRLLALPDGGAATEALLALCAAGGVTDAHGVMLRALPGVVGAVAHQPARRSGGAMRAVQRRISHTTAEIALVLREPFMRRSRAREMVRIERDQAEVARLNRPPDEPGFSASPPSVPRPVDIGESLDDRVRQLLPDRTPPRYARGDDDSLPPSAYLGEPAYAEQVFTQSSAWGDEPTEGARRTSASSDQPLGIPRSRLMRQLRDGARRRRARKVPPRAIARLRVNEGLSYRREQPPFPWIPLFLTIAVVAALMIFGVTVGRIPEQVATQQAGVNIFASAEQTVAAVRSASNETTARARLRDAKTTLDALQATGVISGNVENLRRFEELSREYDRNLAALRRQTYFSELTEVGRHPLPGGLFDSVIVPPPPRSITDTISFGSLYMFDANAHVLYAVSKDGGTAMPILRPDAIVGPLSVGDIRGTAFRFDNVVAVAQSQQGGPYVYYFRDGGAWRYSLLAGSEEWGRIGGIFRIANYEGNLYIWGAARNNVLRYRSGQFGVFPDPWIQNPGTVSIDATVDMAVDGRIYLLQPDGSVVIFATNEATGERAYERTIAAPDVDPPISAATRFFVTGTGETGSIFIVDPARGRVVQLDKPTGAVVQQIMAKLDGPTRLDQLVSMTVDESSGRAILYLVNGGQVLRGTLPERPEPFRPASATTPAATPAATSPGTPAPATATPAAP